MILAEYPNRSILSFPSDHVLVCTVNCVGVMGKGIALEIKKRWPNILKEYRTACSTKSLEIGNCWVWKENSTLYSPGASIICYPTKLHWKDPSKYEYIEKALSSFLSISSYFSVPIVVPRLGCGCGRLDWNKVKEIIYQPLSNSSTKFILL